MNNTLSHIILLISLIFTASCGNDSDPLQTPRPRIDKDTLQLTVGECDTLTVTNATEINATTSSEIITIHIAKNKIIVSAINAGETTISIIADKQKLSCTVSVTAPPPTLNDFSEELNDNRSRYTSPTLSLLYDTPGTIFSIEDNNTIEIHDLNTDNHIKFRSPQMLPGELTDATLHVNGENINLATARLEKYDNTGMWINIITADGENIILVATDMN